MRRALIIGNSNYLRKNEKLENTINDANKIAEILDYKGFDVRLHTDLDEKNLIGCFDSFLDSISENDDVIFYFAGHAIEDRDTNYPLSIDYWDSFNLDTSLTVDKIQNSLSKINVYGFKLIILDACRNNPVSAQSPLPEKIKANNNTLIAFSTSSGSIAKDGSGLNSCYTESLVNIIKEYNLSIHEIFSRVRESVVRHTKFSQVPWEHGSLLGGSNFSFDNLNVPKNLIRIIKSRSNLLHSMKNIDDNFFAAGNSKAIDFFHTKSSASKGIKLPRVKSCEIEAIDANDNYVIFTTHDGKIACVNKNDNKIKIIRRKISFFSAAINRNNKIFFGGSSSKLFGYDLDNSTALEIDIKNDVLCSMYEDDHYIEYLAREMTVMSVAFSSFSANLIAYGGSGSVFCVKDIDKDKYIYMNDNRDIFSYTYCIRFSSDGNYVATTHEGGKTILWDAKTFKLIHIFKTNRNISKTHFFESTNEQHSNHIMCVEFSPDSRSIAIGTSESDVIFYDIKYMKMIARINLNIEPYPIYALAFNKQGDKMFVSLNDKIYLFGAAYSIE